MNTQILKGQNARAAEIIRAGGLCAVPTETVYGLAANGLSHDAVMKLYQAKGRPETKPISLLVSGMEDAERFCRDIPAAAYTLARRFWPGPLTMILWKNDRVPPVVTAGGSTVGVRCPAHPDTLEIIRLCGLPLAAPSANLSGQPSPKSAAEVLAYFDGIIDGVADGGVCRVGVESTIVDLTAPAPRILRQGGLAAEEIFRALEQ